VTHPHPLDPLTPEEIAFVRESILSAPEHAVMPRGARFITVEIRLPEKAAPEARPGDPVDRVARAIVWDTRDGLAYVAELLGPLTPCWHGNPSPAASPTLPSTSGTSATRRCAATRT
jgi:hypothetical protein